MTVRITQTKGKDTDMKFVGMSRGLANAVTSSLQRAVKMAVSYENIAIASMAGPDRRLRNHGAKMSAKGGVRNQKYAAGEAAVGPRGPVAIINNGTVPHLIGVGRASQAKRSRNRVGFKGIHSEYSKYNVETHSGVKKLRLSDRTSDTGGEVWVTAPVLHPGHGGKGQWSRVRDKIVAPEAAKMMRFTISRGAMTGWRQGR